MRLYELEVCCSLCRGPFEEQTTERWICSSCHHTFPVISGIPDLRIFPDPYVDFETDRAKGIELIEQSENRSFEDLVEYYYETTAVVPKHYALHYCRGMFAASERAENALREWEIPASVDGAFLDVGCGTGPLLIAAAHRFRQVIGVDIAFRWLVIARKRLMQSGVSVPLFCACAEALPFRKNQFTMVAFDSALEVVRDQDKALSEARRVLRPGAELRIVTPNRFSLGPDPHLKIWAGGYLPERWVAMYARKQNAIPPVRRLLTGRALRKLILEAGFTSVSVFIPSIPELASKHLSWLFRIMISLYNRIRNWPVIRSIFRAIGPLLQAKAWKPAHDN